MFNCLMQHELIKRTSHGLAVLTSRRAIHFCPKYISADFFFSPRITQTTASLFMLFSFLFFLFVLIHAGCRVYMQENKLPDGGKPGVPTTEDQICGSAHNNKRTRRTRPSAPPHHPMLAAFPTLVQYIETV